MTTNFNLRLDESLKAQSFGVIESFGMTPSQFMRLVLKQVADTGSLPLSFERRAGVETRTLSPKAQARLCQTEQEFANGEFECFDSLDELNKAIAEMARG